MASLTSTSRGQEKQTFAPIPGLPFVYTSTSLTTDIPDVSDSLFNASAKGIRFDVNRTELRPTEPFIGIVRNQLAPILKGKGLVLRKIIVRGAASPEGPYDNNRRLGQGRTARLIDFINSELGLQIDASQIQSDFISEDYEYLAIVMEKAGDKDAATVRRIWLKCQKDERQTKKALMALNGGRNWQRWKAKYFPQLRQARVMMWFGVPVEEIKKAEQKVILPEPTEIKDSTETI